MERRNFTSACLATSASMVLLATRQAYALSLGDLSAGDAASGVRAALEKGASVAVSLLGRPDGFLGNPKVRIPLPGFLNDSVKLLKMIGKGEIGLGVDPAATPTEVAGDVQFVTDGRVFTRNSLKDY